VRARVLAFLTELLEAPATAPGAEPGAAPHERAVTAR
jgi:hypothetical protein